VCIADPCQTHEPDPKRSYKVSEVAHATVRANQIAYEVHPWICGLRAADASVRRYKGGDRKEAIPGIGDEPAVRERQRLIEVPWQEQQATGLVVNELSPALPFPREAGKGDLAAEPP
jgi:hypothetical protein